MDLDLINVINHIKKIKEDMYLIHKPELVNGHHVINNARSVVKPDLEQPEHSKAYETLMRQQRKLNFKKNNQSKVKKDEVQKDKVPNDDSITKDVSVLKSSSINFRSAREEMSEHSNEMHKPWHKLPNNLKIQAIIKFIDKLTPNLTTDQVNQLRYLLISAVTEKKITRAADVDYDVVNGQILKINRLIWNPEGQRFQISINHESNLSIGIDYIPKFISSTPIIIPENTIQSKPKLKPFGVKIVLKNPTLHTSS